MKCFYFLLGPRQTKGRDRTWNATISGRSCSITLSLAVGTGEQRFLKLRDSAAFVTSEDTYLRS